MPGGEALNAIRQQGEMMGHFHITLIEPGPGARTRGALCTTRAAAEQEKRVEEEGSPHRKVDIEECSQASWGQSPFIQKQHA
jgi:hypothetical protein